MNLEVRGVDNAICYLQVLAKWRITMERKWCRQGNDLLREIKEMAPEKDELIFWYIGQCGFVYKKEVTVYIDPVLNGLEDENGDNMRYYPSPFSPDKVTADYVLCTHGHKDHLAVETLAGIASADLHTKFIVPGDCIETLTSAGIESSRIVEARAKEGIQLPGLTVLPLQAAHPVHQKSLQGKEVALCYQLTMGDIRILHLGDTYLTEQLLQDLLSLKAPDLFFAPINGGDYFRTARDCIGNLNMLETANLSVMLKAVVTIPTHYDMVKGNTVEPLDFVRTLRELDSSTKWQLPALGESVIYRQSNL